MTGEKVVSLKGRKDEIKRNKTNESYVDQKNVYLSCDSNMKKLSWSFIK